MKYIDAEELKKKFNGAFREVHVDQIKAMIDEMPDALVRCKDCVYWQDNNDGYPHENCKWNSDETPYADDYCSEAHKY